MTGIMEKANTLWMQLMGKVALAEGWNQKVGDNEYSMTGENGFKSLAEFLTNAMTAVGVIFVVIGAISIATSIKSGEQNPEAITGAVKNILVGLLLIGIKFVLAWFITK